MTKATAIIKSKKPRATPLCVFCKAKGDTKRGHIETSDIRSNLRRGESLPVCVTCRAAYHEGWMEGIGFGEERARLDIINALGLWEIADKIRKQSKH